MPQECLQTDFTLQLDLSPLEREVLALYQTLAVKLYKLSDEIQKIHQKSPEKTLKISWLARRLRFYGICMDWSANSDWSWNIRIGLAVAANYEINGAQFAKRHAAILVLRHKLGKAGPSKLRIVNTCSHPIVYEIDNIPQL
ncbi:hypothetical protein HF325_002721 [Metschnikowia pulcherrima]|uniref:Uncharacterized protein n=1 Tax=Metschnikowia pulcherrima TaxID=27326 RepID=A0A8H7LB31_9ASCO|nr:hypothetical protein HF325_002721 [Metschnikowia pulcherrima]